MSRMIAVPDDVYEKAAKIAGENHVSVDEFISAALVDQLSTREYIARRASRSSEAAFREALAQIPDVEPEEYDRL